MYVSKGGKTRDAMITSPAAFGCTPSLRSVVGNPVLQSAITMGEAAVDVAVTQAGIASFKAVSFALLGRGITRSTWSRLSKSESTMG